MSGTPFQYQRHYGVALLDDLHNYFPELLYGDVAQFQTVGDVLAYIRNTTHARFDLFSSGAAAARGAMRSAQLSRAAARGGRTASSTRLGGGGLARPPRPAELRAREWAEDAESTGAAAAAAAPRRVPRPPAAAAAAAPARIFTTMQEAESTVDALENLLVGTMMGGGGGLGRNYPLQLDPSPISLLFNMLNPNSTVAPAIAPGALDPVIVRPSQEQIDAGTVTEIVDADDENCAICQDRLEPGSNACALVACDHRFHPGCIGTWFQRDVHCPICRHDIREPAAEEAAAAAGQN